MPNKYYSGQGRLYVAERDGSGKPMGFTELGNAPALEISIETTKFEHKESQTGARAVDLTIVQEKRGTFTMTLESLTIENLALAFWGQSANVEAGTSVTATVPAYLGKRMPLGHPQVSNVTVKDETDTTSYIEGTDYDIDAANGTLILLEGGSITEGELLNVSLDHAAYGQVDAFTESSMERWLRFEGLNTIDDKPVIVDIFKAQLDPLQGYGLINEELGSVEVAGSVLYDDLQPGVSKFFRQQNVA